MRFLVDAQLPPALARFLTSQGHDAEHVLDVGMERSTDAAVWARALETGAVIVTKDEDFSDMVMLSRESPPVVWVRLGNTRRDYLIEQFGTQLPRIVALISEGDRLVELRSGSGPTGTERPAARA